METLIILVFAFGYLAITLEHNLKLDKLIPALGMMASLWALVSFGIEAFPNWFDSAEHKLIEGFAGFSIDEKHHLLEETLLHHLGKTAEILFFLMGAMTIVEIIDYFDGFATFKSYIKTKSKNLADITRYMISQCLNTDIKVLSTKIYSSFISVFTLFSSQWVACLFNALKIESATLSPRQKPCSL